MRSPSTDPPRRRPRRQPHPVRPVQQPSTPTSPTRRCSPPPSTASSARFGLEGERLGEVVAGAVLKHSRDFNLARECVLGSKLAPETPATDIQQACGTGLQAGDPGGQQDRPRPDRGRHRRRLRHHLRRAGRRQREAAQEADEGQRGQGHPRAGSPRWRRIRPGDIGLDIPQNGEPRTGLSMGEHAALTALEWRIGREEQDELAAALAPATSPRSYDEGFHDDLVTPFRGVERDNNLRADSTVEKLAKLKPVFGKGEAATMTAGNSHAAHRRRLGGAAGLGGVGRRARTCPCWPTSPPTRPPPSTTSTAGEGLLMAPAYAVARMLQREGLTPAGLRLLRDPRGVRLAGALHAQGVGGPGLLQGAPRPRRPAGRRSTATKLNVNGSSLAAAHPFAATGGRIVPVLAKLLDQKGSGRGLISICAAGGQGVVAILEK